VFSPYYRRAHARGRGDPHDHIALNLALYGPGRRWTMTERGRGQLQRSARELSIGPSRVHWDGQSLRIDIDEIGMPLPRRVRGQVRVHPQGLSHFVAPLDAQARHRWGPIAPCARIEVDLDRPSLRWRGHAYLDSNEGDEPVDRAFREWDWSRALLADGSTAVVYDVRERGSDGAAPPRLIAQRFAADGRSQAFAPPPPAVLQSSTLLVSGGAAPSYSGFVPPFDCAVKPKRISSQGFNDAMARAKLPSVLPETVRAMCFTAELPQFTGSLLALPVALLS